MTHRTSTWTLLLMGCLASACGGKKLLTITFPDKQGTAEYYICDRDARHCHPTKQGDIDDFNYAPKMDSISPPAECPFGAAKMELVVVGDRVERINYECAKADPGIQKAAAVAPRDEPQLPKEPQPPKEPEPVEAPVPADQPADETKREAGATAGEAATEPVESTAP